MARGTGQTHAQLAAAKPGAMFVWCNENTRYPEYLARKINRGDIVIFGSRIFSYPELLLGQKFSEIVLDYALVLSPREELNYRDLVPMLVK